MIFYPNGKDDTFSPQDKANIAREAGEDRVGRLLTRKPDFKVEIESTSGENIFYDAIFSDDAEPID